MCDNDNDTTLLVGVDDTENRARGAYALRGNDAVEWRAELASLIAEPSVVRVTFYDARGDIAHEWTRERGTYSFVREDDDAPAPARENPLDSHPVFAPFSQEARDTIQDNRDATLLDRRTFGGRSLRDATDHIGRGTYDDDNYDEDEDARARARDASTLGNRSRVVSDDPTRDDYDDTFAATLSQFRAQLAEPERNDAERVTELEEGIRRYLSGEGYSDELLALLGDDNDNTYDDKETN